MSPVQKTRSPNPLHLAWRTPRRGAVVLLLGVLLLYFVGLGRLDLWAPDEPRYGAIAEELRSFRHGASGLVLLHLNDSAYTQKPPLYFWLAALAGAPSGRVGELAARLPSALFGVGGVALTALIARRLLGHPTLALLAAGLLATSFRFAFTARRAQLDVVLTGFELIAIAIFLHLELGRAGLGSDPETSRGRRPSRAAIAGLHAALGAAALVKGPVGWLPLAIIAVYLAWQGRLRSFRLIAPPWAWALSIGPVCLWILGAVALAPPGFAEIAVGENLIGRFFGGTAHARPLYYYLGQLPLDFLPWTLLLPFGLVWIVQRARPSRAGDPTRGAVTAAAARFLLVWISVPLLFFSLSAGKRGLYLLPVFPALAMVAAIGAVRLVPKRAGPEAGAWDPASAARRSGWVVAGVGALELALFVLALPLLHEEKSPRPIAVAAARRTEPGEAIGVFGLTPIEGAIPYYGERPVASLSNEEELRLFLDTGVLETDARIVLLRARDFERMATRLGLIRLEGFRSGRRELLLARRRELGPLGDPSGSNEADSRTPPIRESRRRTDDHGLPSR